MTTPPITYRDRAALARFIIERANATKAEVGFGWHATKTAPSTFQQLRGAYAHSLATGADLPVSSEYCDQTIYSEPAINHAFRFWHDCSHVRQGLSFGLQDELELALWHLAQLEHAGHAPDTAVYRLLQADLVGQLLTLAFASRFPFNQDSFASECLRNGDIFTGLLHEIRRTA